MGTPPINRRWTGRSGTDYDATVAAIGGGMPGLDIDEATREVDRMLGCLVERLSLTWPEDALKFIR